MTIGGKKKLICGEFFGRLDKVGSGALDTRGVWGRRIRGCAVCFFFQAEDGIRDLTVTGVQTCALPISGMAQGRTRDVLEALAREQEAGADEAAKQLAELRA